METYFSMNASFQVVETDFLANANQKLFFHLMETYFLTNPSFQLLEKDFSLVEPVYIIWELESSFLLAEIVTDMNGNLTLAGGNSFSS